MAPLPQLLLLGPVGVNTAAGAAAEGLGHKSKALLALLGSTPEGQLERGRIAGLLWADHDEDGARRNLRQLLLSLRQSLGGTAEEILVADRDTIGLRLDSLDIDVRRFEAGACSDDSTVLASACRLRRGPFCDGLDVGSEAFREWLAIERARLDELAIQIHRLLGRLLAEAGDIDAAIETVRKLVALSPLDDDAHASLISLYRRRGWLGPARDAYRRCVDFYKRELGEGPGEEVAAALTGPLAGGAEAEPFPMARAHPTEVRALVQESFPRREAPEAKSGPAFQTTAPWPIRAIMPDRPSIAVRPFRVLGGWKQKALAAGFANDIAVELTRNRDLVVMARETIRRLAGQSVVEHAARLGVRYVVDGSLQRLGDHLLIHVFLIDGVTGRQIWAERHQVDAAGLPEMQLAIVMRVVGTLLSSVREAERSAVLRRPFRNFDVYDLTLRGMACAHDPIHLIVRHELLSRAVALDPDYAPAHAHLGWAITSDIMYGSLTGRFGFTDLDRAVAETRRAINIEPTLPAAYLALSFALGTKGDSAGSLVAARHSVELGPGDAENILFLSIAEARAGLYLAALDDARRAVEIDPIGKVDNGGTLGVYLYANDLFREAVATLSTCVERSPRYTRGWLHKAASEAAVGRMDAARESVRRLLDIAPFDTAKVAKISPFPSDPDMTARYIDHLRAAGLPAGRE